MKKNLSLSELVALYKSGNSQTRMNVWFILRKKGYSSKYLRSLVK